MTPTKPNLEPRPRKPRFKITWWMRVKHRIRMLETPLMLRGTIKRLRHNNKWPYLAFLRLLLPTRSLGWKYPVPEPISPRALIDGDPMLSWHRRLQTDVKNLQCVPIWRSRDTPLRALYRLYETAMNGEATIVVIGYETEYFWYQDRKSWDLDRIPDPRDPNPVRYAIIACFVEALVDAFNWRLSLGMRKNGKHIFRDKGSDPWPPYTPIKGPEWARDVPPVKTEFIRDNYPERLDEKGRFVLLEDGDSDIFDKRNISATEARLYTI
ncbi:hypothetical protein FQN54_000052 [Arachnomyces sp. PD_36]|nr:hypothetical protein FQN54_000052 [Arachnomyces sp. PD_36]